ncbi:MAG: glycosyltransferase family 2 protein, partial [Candidatus Moranbacteria bacterium]|nr:glycosyltransferase family 2 protein [Candidatus Moranbacteria bacterium]
MLCVLCSMHPELSIIITNYKNPDLLKVCIDAVRKNYTGSDYEIIVSDSGTEEETEMMMREDYPEIKFIPSKENIGFGATMRNGYELSQGDYILILNGDVIIKKDSVKKLLDYIKNNPKVGIAGPQLLNFNETLQPSCFRFYKPLTIIYRRTFLGKFGLAQKNLDWFLMKDFDHRNIKEVDWLMGSALMTSRQAMEKIGPMDPRFKMYLEDTDWCRRFWENKLRVVYFPQSQMYHYHGKGSAGRGVFKSLLHNRLTWVHIASAIK